MKLWIGVDLDKTLAEYHDGDDIKTIGKPIPEMVERVSHWVSEGKVVKIFTARAATPSQVPIIKQWLKDNKLPDLEVTNEKDQFMIELWDDRARQVKPNTGELMHSVKLILDLEKSDYTRIRNNKLEHVHNKVVKKEEVTNTSDERVRIVAKERGLIVPPAWTDLWISDDPEAPLQVRGTDKKGRVIRLYSAKAMEAKAIEKFNRLKSFTKDFPKIFKQIEQDFDNKEEARVLYIISKTGFRVGSERDRQADVKAFGVSTLTSDHINIKGNKIEFDFIGKKGVKIHQILDDKRVADYLRDKEGKLFNTSEEKTLAYLKSISHSDYMVKDFRGFVANVTAIKIIKSLGKAVSEKDKLNSIKHVCKLVAEKLGNTPTVAKESYIDPMVWDLL